MADDEAKSAFHVEMLLVSRRNLPKPTETTANCFDRLSQIPTRRDATQRMQVKAGGRVAGGRQTEDE
jgi:hypothetical protein